MLKTVTCYGVFPLTESDSDSNILSDSVIMETIKICRNRHTGSDSDMISVQILMGTVPIFSDRKEYLNLNLKNIKNIKGGENYLNNTTHKQFSY